MLDSESQNLLAAADDVEYRVVFYEYCISLIFITLRRPSRLYRLRKTSWGLLPGLRYTLVTLLLGWWGIPFGFIYTPLVLWTNLSGGREITAEEWQRLRPSSESTEN